MASTRGFLAALCVIWIASWMWAKEAVAMCTPGAIHVNVGDIGVSITKDISCCDRCNETVALNGSFPCYCDEHCLVYRDCCLDFELYCTDVESQLVQRGEIGLLEAFRNCSGGINETNATMIGNSENDEHEESSFMDENQEYMEGTEREYVCKLEELMVPVILARHSNRSLVRVAGGHNFDYVLIGNCWSDTAEEELVSLCEGMDSETLKTLGDVKEVVPVTAPDGLHYRNAYCARCSGFSEVDLQFWQVELNCPDNVKFTGLTDSSIATCKVDHVTPPLSFIWAAPPPHIIVSSYECLCNRSEVLVCAGYLLNQCCRSVQCRNQCHCLLVQINDPESGKETPQAEFLPISALFDFSSHRDLRFSLGDQPPQLVCNQNSFFDFALGSCRKFFCPSGQSLGTHGECVAADTDPCLSSGWGEPPDHLLVLEFKTNLSDVDPLQSYLMRSLNVSVNIGVTPSYPVDCLDVGQLLHCTLLAVIDSQYSFDEISTLFLARMSMGALEAHRLLNSNVTFENLTLRNFRKVEFLIDICARLGQTPVRYSFGSDYKKFEINGTSYVNIRVENGSVTCPFERAYKEVVFNSSGHVEEFVYLCEMKLNCSLVVLNSSDFRWLDNTTVELSSGVSLSNEEIIKISEEEVVVCRQPDGPCANCRNSNAVGILSIVGLIVSQVFLLLTLLSFCVFPELCTLPGKNLFCFISALFLTQMVFLLGPGSPMSQFTTASYGTCLAFAVTIHYLLLATFFWSNVVSLHLARTFGFRLRMRSESFGRAFLWYSLYGWGAPCLLTATGCVLHHFLVVDEIRVVIYGIDSPYCIPSENGMLYLVAVPVSVLMSSNAVFFVQTVVGIRRTRKSTSMIEKENRRFKRLQSEVVLCVKIFVTTGMTWFLIAVLGYFKVDGFSYFFTVLISSQGPLLFFSFVFTERIRNMWRAKLYDRVRRPDEFASKDTVVSSISQTVGGRRDGHAGHCMHNSSDESLIRADGKAMLLEDKNMYEQVCSDNNEQIWMDNNAQENQF